MNFQIKQEKFEGPLELLVQLIEREKLSISEVSLARVTEDYIRYVKSFEKLDPEALAGFLVIAAQLMLIKSRSLLPSLKFSEEEEASLGELEQRLSQYQRIRALAEGLKKRGGQRLLIASRESYFGMNSVFYPPPNLTLDTMREAFIGFLAALPKFEKLVRDKIKRIISLEERMRHIQTFLQQTLEQKFSDIIKGAKEKIDVIISFLAILELAKQKFIELKQEELFQDIVVKRSPIL